MPRKLKLTEEFIKKAVKYLEAGNYQTHVAQALGVSHETWFRWLREGQQEGKGIKYEFYEAVKKAEARAAIRNVAIIQRAAQDNWQAAAWWLERKFPEEWGRKDKYNVDVGGEFMFEIIEVDGRSGDDEADEGGEKEED